MNQRFTDYLTSKAAETPQLSRSTRFFRLALVLIVLAIPTFLCGFLINFKVAFQLWLLILATIIPLVFGVFIIWKYLWKNQKLALVSIIALLSFIFFLFGFLGSLFDPRANNTSLQDKFFVALLSASLPIVWSVIVLPLYLVISRIVNRTKNNR